ncbi:diheme cytochrome c [Nitrosophilus alvini]|uniref:diheme cytochrome c n=1 Tax=Nitrosophilus alvini TaxID=2714855 RepID=UPI00190B5F74|nr:diheme cytochrome c [Nitrosophilus alvini]
MKKYLIFVIVAGVFLGSGVSIIADDDEYKRDRIKKERSIYEQKHEYRLKSRYAEDNEHEDDENDEDDYKESKRIKKYENVTKTSQEYRLYKEECGSCHMAYQPEFLLKRSWEKMMQTLEDHFGTDASLEGEEYKKVYEYLMKNAADSKRVRGEFKEIAKSIAGYETPLRISETYYFKKEHRKIPAELVTQKEVKSIANCGACHKRAQDGIYSERDIFIPNYGKWDD